MLQITPRAPRARRFRTGAAAVLVALCLAVTAAGGAGAAKPKGAKSKAVKPKEAAARKAGKSAQEGHFYVDPADGNDGWDGKSPKPKAKSRGPFATAARARDAARALNKRAGGAKRPPVTIHLRDGNHYL